MSSGASPESAPFAAHYAQLTESDLFAVARDYESLTEPAQFALRTEFARRSLDPPLIEEEVETAERKLARISHMVSGFDLGLGY